MRAAVSQRIDMLRFLMIFGVVVVHAPPYTPFGSVPDGWLPMLVSFFQNAVFRGTVPLLTLISGYCLFKSGQDTQFGKLIARKARTLLVPFLIFNFGMLFFDVLSDRLFGLSIVFDPAAMNVRTWLNATFAVFNTPINMPLYFLRDLMVLMVLAPAFGWLLRRAPIAGLIGIAVLFLTNMDGYLILRDDMPVEFFLGGILACKKMDICALDKYAYSALGVFIAACLYVVWVDEDNANILALRLVAPFLIWPVGAVMVGTPFGQWLVKQSRYSFFIFICHAPVLFFLGKMNQRLGEPVPDVAFPLIMPFVVVALLIAMYKCASAVMPGPFAIATGGRAKPKVRYDRRTTPVLPGLWPASSERRATASRTA
jgi:succinoglycan biosynthesis protein ExoH